MNAEEGQAFLGTCKTKRCQDLQAAVPPLKDPAYTDPSQGIIRTLFLVAVESSFAWHMLLKTLQMPLMLLGAQGGG